jgi:hypothetical protein
MKYMFSQFDFESKNMKTSIFHNPIKYNHTQNITPKYKNNVHINKKEKPLIVQHLHKQMTISIGMKPFTIYIYSLQLITN